MRNLKFSLAALFLSMAFSVTAQEQATTEVEVLALADPESVPEELVEPDLSPALQADDVNAWLDGFLPYALEIANIRGAVVVVVKNGEILTQRGFGYADAETRKPVDPELTLFRPGSVSKLVTWTAVMQLVEAGKIDLDADVNQYLDFSVPAEGKPITMRNILTHTGGFEDVAKNLLYFDPERHMTLGEYLKSWVPDQVFEPGLTPAYSNYTTSLAGYIVERVSGQSFDDYVDEHIFAPLDMNNSTFRQPLPERLAGQMSSGYKPGDSEAIKFEIVGPAPAGSLSSSGMDMGHFMIAHLQQGRYGDRQIFSPETAELMHNSPLTIIPHLNRMELGFFETNINGRQVIAHLGDLQAFHTALHLFMEENVGLYFSTNSPGDKGEVGKLRLALFEDFADRYLPAENNEIAVANPEIEAGHAAQMAGVWQVSRGARSNFFGALGLLGQTKITVGADGELLIPSSKGLNGQPKKWVEVEPYLWHEVGGHDRVAAVVEDGEVVRWSMDGVSPFMVYDRVPAAVSSAWLLPAMQVSLAALTLTFLFWPIGALARRRYKATLALQGSARKAYRLSRLFSGLILAVFIGWALVISAMMKDFSNMSDVMNPWLWTLQIAGVLVFTGALLVMLWNAKVTWGESRRWMAKLWSLVLVFSAATILWMAYAYKLIAFTVDF
jgi:CubicO group peptidase (beta-lactamase class C family)